MRHGARGTVDRRSARRHPRRCFSRHAHGDLRDAIALCEKKGDFISRQLLDDILENEEEYLDWLETQMSLIKDMGLPNYIQSQA